MSRTIVQLTHAFDKSVRIIILRWRNHSPLIEKLSIGGENWVTLGSLQCTAVRADIPDPLETIDVSLHHNE